MRKNLKNLNLSFFILNIIFLIIIITLISTGLFQVKKEELKAKHQIISKVISKNIQHYLKLGVYPEVKRYCNQIKSEGIVKRIKIKLENKQVLCDLNVDFSDYINPVYFDEQNQDLIATISYTFPKVGFLQLFSNSKNYFLFIFPIIIMYFFSANLFFNYFFSKPIERLMLYIKNKNFTLNLAKLELNEFKRIKELIDEYNKIESEKTRMLAENSISAQVAHDIRSPLTALEMATKDLNSLPEEVRIMIRGGISRIQDIANNLLANRKKIKEELSNIVSGEKEVTLISSLVESIVSEKRTHYRNKINIKINFNMDEKSYGLFSEVNKVELKRILSNLINNSVEAFIKESGRILLSLNSDDTYIILKVSDNGNGIPANILSQIGKNEITYGKPNGNGLGLIHAKSIIEKWGGNFTIISKEEVGTDIIVKLKKESAPKWFVESLDINSDIVILDDDSSIHHVWEERFKAINYKIIHFTTVQEAKYWFLNNGSKYLFLCDFELLGQDYNGLDFIKKYADTKKSILVTSRYEETKIRERCQLLGVNLIPKPMASIVPIKLD